MPHRSWQARPANSAEGAQAHGRCAALRRWAKQKAGIRRPRTPRGALPHALVRGVPALCRRAVRDHEPVRQHRDLSVDHRRSERRRAPQDRDDDRRGGAGHPAGRRRARRRDPGAVRHHGRLVPDRRRHHHPDPGALDATRAAERGAPLGAGGGRRQGQGQPGRLSARDPDDRGPWLDGHGDPVRAACARAARDRDARRGDRAAVRRAAGGPARRRSPVGVPRAPPASTW